MFANLPAKKSAKVYLKDNHVMISILSKKENTIKC